MATTALALTGGLAAAPASAADMLSVGVGGYMQQWFGMSSVDDSAKPMKEGGVAQQSDSEIIFKGKLEADNGLTFSVKVEVEANSASHDHEYEDGDEKTGKSSSNAIDESQLTVSGTFGQIVLGAEDGASVITHHGVRDAGFGINCGDVGAWINGIDSCKDGLETAGHQFGDGNGVSYYSPRVGGVQFGMTYVPNGSQEGNTASLNNNDADTWSIGGNYKGDFGGANVAVFAGHREHSQDMGDAYSFSNFGLQVGMGAFSFDVAYAASDDGSDEGKKKDSADDYEVVGAGAMYTDGPMSVSLSHMMVDHDNGTEQSATMLSGSYTLAPGVAWSTSIFAAEKDRVGGDDDGTSVEGSGFVTGFQIGF